MKILMLINGILAWIMSFFMLGIAYWVSENYKLEFSPEWAWTMAMLFTLFFVFAGSTFMRE